ncbi:hypothetical protein ACFW04_011540 [Cataglyphis niger]
MRTYIETHPEEFGEARGPPQTPRIEVHPPSTPTDRTPDNPILNQLRKWGRPFDGRNPVEFLERTDDLLEEYGFSGDQLLRGLSELLRGDPLAWARNNRCDWETWADFCRAFRRRYLPPRYQEDLERQIADRRQHDSERFAPYADAMMTMMRRAGRFTREQRLTRIYANMRPEYKRYIKRRDVHDLNDLLEEAAEFEGIEQETREVRKASKDTANPPAVAAVYNREECCWRCKQRGHTRFDCRRPPRRFCSQCGKDGVLTKDCHPPTGNANRAGKTTADSRAPRMA